jgi:hypothetical protein
MIQEFGVIFQTLYLTLIMQLFFLHYYFMAKREREYIIYKKLSFYFNEFSYDVTLIELNDDKLDRSEPSNDSLLAIKYISLFIVPLYFFRR